MGGSAALEGRRAPAQQHDGLSYSDVIAGLCSR
jgi:hypothetical protein